MACAQASDFLIDATICTVVRYEP